MSAAVNKSIIDLLMAGGVASREEAAQLQGFPIGMTFAGTTSAKYRQIGNAVPPPLGFAVARAVAASLGVERPRGLERAAA